MKTNTMKVKLLVVFWIICAFVLAHGAALSAESADGLPLSPPEPLVAIHVSELTQALETMPAVAPTPIEPWTSGFQWWLPAWRYLVGHESLKEALRSDGTPFAVVSDSEIAAGILLKADGSPRYPIVISLGSEAIDNNEIAPLRAYVNAGGFLFVGSSAFTRNPDGTTRGNFALANEMGLRTARTDLQNWYLNEVFQKTTNHAITSHIPTGTLTWSMPIGSGQIPSGVDPASSGGADVHKIHGAWQVTASGATVLANGGQGPILTVKNYGQGYIIWHGAMQPLVGHGGFDPGMYAYVIYRKAIEWAFQTLGVPIVKVSPWRYPYDAALMVRHDFENDMSLIRSIRSSAQFEKSLGIKGDYYFCTGTLRAYTGSDRAQIISNLRSAVSSYGATIGSHNGGLPHPAKPSLTPADYGYWHWGPDEALDQMPSGYPSGAAYASASILASYTDIEGWLTGLDNGRAGCGAGGTCPRTWVSPFFNSTRDASVNILQGLGSITMGERKIGPFPHRTFSYETPGLRYSQVTLPLSDWYVGDDIAQTLEAHTVASVRAGVDFYYDLGALINFYGHSPSDTSQVTQEYITYSVSKPALWSTNSVGIYDWWNLRSQASVEPAISKTGNTYTVTASVSGATDPQSAIEVVLPYIQPTVNSPPAIVLGPIEDIQLFLNGMPAGPSDYRATDYGVKVLVGSSVSDVAVQYSLPTSVTFTATRGGSNPAKTLSISNGGGGTLNWTATANSTSPAWLSVSPTIGTGAGTMTVSANISGLATGTYTKNITISATGASNTPQTVTVTLTVTNTVTLDDLFFNLYSVKGGNSVLGAVRISVPAPSGGTVVSLSSSIWVAQVPATVTVPEGSIYGEFTITTSVPYYNTSATITAAHNSINKKASLYITR